VGKYTSKKKRATKKRALSQKESEKLKRASVNKRANKPKPRASVKKRRAKPKPRAKRVTIPNVSCPVCGARSGKACKGRSTHVARTKKAAVAKKRRKTPAQKRGAKNKKIVKRVERRNKLRDDSRAKSLAERRKKELAKRVREEKKRIERLRLLDEKLRQVQEEQQRQAASKSEIVATLQKRFGTLLNEARRTGQMPRTPHSRTIASDRLSGHKRHLSVGEILVPELIEEIMYQVKEKAKTLSQRPAQGWLGVINFASLGESLLGYGQIILSSSLPGASLFQTQGILSTGISNARDGMLIKLEEKLEELAGETSATVFINFITISAYTRRT
jgi:uncharacterized Zn finger protein (UPF0148 family)